MAKSTGKGSIIYKILIVILAGALVSVILIPDSIWEEEKREKEQSRYNMSSIYEAERYFFGLTKSYTTDVDTLLQVLDNDSTIDHNQKLVEYTIRLKDEIESYLAIPSVNGFVLVYQNIDNIKDDLETNERYFRADESILNEASELRLRLTEFESDINYPFLSQATLSLDSLYQLQRDLSDFNLQTAASMAKDNASHLNPLLPEIKWNDFANSWQTLDTRLQEFIRKVDDSEVSKFTSVADRIKDFAADVRKGLSTVQTANSAQDFQSASEIEETLEAMYKEFLADFIITSRSAMYRLSESDSMILGLSKENFSSPVSGEPYLMQLNADSTDIKVESPLLVDDLKEMLKPVADAVSGFQFINTYLTYADTLDSIHQKGLDIKTVLRRNIEITIKNKEIEEEINNYKTSSEYQAAKSLSNFLKTYNSSRSFSDIEKSVEEARNAISIFEQIYSGNLFGNIDSIHVSMIGHLDQYDTLLNDLRRMPRGVETFEQQKQQLQDILSSMKQSTSNTASEYLKNLQTQLEEAFLFAEQGKKIRVYGVFKKTIENMGYIFNNSKSWEEKEKK